MSSKTITHFQEYVQLQESDFQNIASLVIHIKKSEAKNDYEMCEKNKLCEALVGTLPSFIRFSEKYSDKGNAVRKWETFPIFLS